LRKIVKGVVMVRTGMIGNVRAWVLVLCCWALSLPVAQAASCNKPFSDVFRDISPSVVRIFSVTIDPFSLTKRVKLAVGTGVVIDDQGHIVTNAHVVYGAREVIVSIGDEDMNPATIVGVDPISDLAVVKLAEGDRKLPKARLLQTNKVAIGDEVLAIGYPFAIGKTATRGIVSGRERIVPLSPFSWMMPFIQTDAAINPGNSGGPLVNRCGEIIGINTLGVEKGEDVGFAIPAALVRELVPQLIKNGRVIRPWHGINGRMVPLQFTFALGIAQGFLVETVEPGSPADKIGLRGGTMPVTIGAQEYLLGGDVITSVNGERITSLKTAARIARSLKVGEKIKLTYSRDGRTHTAEVVLPERPILPGDVRQLRE
jgi:S1-C subfamily serine protease